VLSPRQPRRNRVLESPQWRAEVAVAGGKFS
jgi:hypothetical protein